MVKIFPIKMNTHSREIILQMTTAATLGIVYGVSCYDEFKFLAIA